MGLMGLFFALELCGPTKALSGIDFCTGPFDGPGRLSYKTSVPKRLWLGALPPGWLKPLRWLSGGFLYARMKPELVALRKWHVYVT